MSCPKFDTLRRYAFGANSDGDLTTREVVQITGHLHQESCEKCNMRLRYIMANPNERKPPKDERKDKEKKQPVEGSIGDKHVVVGDVIPAHPVTPVEEDRL